MTINRVAQASLRSRNTFGVGATARRLIETDDIHDLPALFAEEFAATSANASPLILGGGSNLLLVGDVDIALSLNAERISIVDIDDARGIIRAEAGAQWHGLVMWTLAHGYCGLENLALIPGTVGAAPIQNIGAYGVEVGEWIHAVDVFERSSGEFQRLDAADCRFAYRDSIFKHSPDRWLVTAVEFSLHKIDAQRAPMLKLDYAGIGEELAAMKIVSPHAQDVAEAVIRLRRRKLPDPALIGNAGSFFKNPIVPIAQADTLLQQYPTLPVFSSGDDATRKLSAAWLIDACGWKGARADFGSKDAGVSDRHALVLVNHGNASGAELLELARRIAGSVHTHFDITIEPEPRIVGTAW